MNFVTLGEEGEVVAGHKFGMSPVRGQQQTGGRDFGWGGEKKDKTIARKLAQHNLKRTKIKEKEKKDTDRQTDKIITVLVDMTEVLVDMTKVLVDMTEGNILSVHTDHFQLSFKRFFFFFIFGMNVHNWFQLVFQNKTEGTKNGLDQRFFFSF